MNLNDLFLFLLITIESKKFHLRTTKEINSFNSKVEQNSKNYKVNPNFLKQKYYELKNCNNINILEINIKKYQQLLEDNKLTSEQMVNCYIKRIEVIDPELKTVLQLNKNAPAIARALDEERKKGKLKGPLHGVPILIKDNISTGDGLLNTAGSKTLKDSAPKVMAHLITKLKAAGAIVLGKANLSIWSEVPSNLDFGWSPRGGQVRNPYILSANPMGSSSGSAVAVSANLAMAAIGSDTHGSIFAPAATSGVVGFKPTAGLVSRHAVIPFSLTHDTVGPITRTLMDAALIMDVIAGPDKKDKHNKHVPLEYKPPKYSRLTNNKQLSGLTIGIDRSMLNGISKDQYTIVNNFINYIKKFKAKIVFIDESIEPETRNRKFDNKIHMLIDNVEFKEGMREYLETVKEHKVHNLTEINNLNVHKLHEHDAKSLELIDKLRLNLTSNEYLKAIQVNFDWYGRDGVDRVLKKYKLDVILSKFGRPCHKIGYPILTLPMPVDNDGLPIKNPAFCTTKLNEDKLFTVGFALENFSSRPIPQFKKCCSKTYDNPKLEK